ncbi:MAG TPA: FAD-binding oxidoreductase [Steroidobacteraceae bacterium]|jgi:FAD/FMN-containing dehydrogenase|nr:FAD-binding oxidoreductase [Steroidobacteraceae bacterium]
MKRRDFVQSSLWAAAAVGIAEFRAVHATARPGSVADVAAVTGDGREITLRGKDLQDLAAKLHGQLLLAGDGGYDDARHVLNPSFDKHPALIVQPIDVADVQAAVTFARANNLLVAVKCGGHSHSGQSTCDKGMQIDLSTFRSVKVDPTARRATVAGGSLLGMVDKATAPHELVTPLGTVSHTGVGGLTLGGGFGRVARKFGMAIDNVESVDVVTADGKLVHASAKDNPELYWGARGGSGNFGVVTQFEFKLHPMQREVVAGSVAFPIARARDVLTMWSEYAATAPDELYVDPSVMQLPGNAPGMAGLQVCYCGSPSGAEKALAPIRKLGTPLKDTIKTMEYTAVQRSGDSSDTRAIASYLKGGFVAKVPGDLITAMVDGFHGDPRRTTVLFAQHCGGAGGRVAENATAFAHRYAIANLMTVVAWPVGDQDSAPHIEAARTYWKTLQPFTGGFYVNDMAREVTAKDINENYRGNYQRLVALKTKYDPTNLFRLNANITPTKT